MNQKFDVLKAALTGGIYVAGCAVLSTIFSIMHVPGFSEFTRILVSFYGFWGYSVSWFGIFVGAFWGFIEGFIHVGIFVWLYNKLTK